MVAFHDRVKNNCAKTFMHDAAQNSIPPPPNSNCESGKESSTKISMSPLIHKSKPRRLVIKTDMSQPQKIGLKLNTNVHLKPKKSFDCSHLFNELVIFILIFYGVMSYFENRKLKGEVEVMKLKLRALEDLVNLTFEHTNAMMNSFEKNNRETMDAIKTVIQSFENDSQDAKTEENDVIKHSVVKREAGRACSNCSSNARTARSVARGKNTHCKNRNGSHGRCFRTSGPLALHLRGALPEITVRDGGIISPWYVDKSSSGSFLLADGIVGERKGVLEIAEEGLYYIYAQIYYLTSSSLNSYAINVQVADSRGREDTVVSVCSAEAAVTKMSELSCFTATVRYLQRGDRLYVTQRERNRRIIFRDNQSFLGLVLLNSHHVVNNK